jgi:gamma-glutamylcyclotransferase (GGCT)/AIG2-like uncharacterized protein YtfP
MRRMPLLFSYGTLQQEQVQRDTFGRVLVGHPDLLPAFELTTSRDGRHANVLFNGRFDSRVSGTVYEVTDAELVEADGYEQADDYSRVQVTLVSGRPAWVYQEDPMEGR